MSTVLNVREARAQFSRLLESARFEGGEYLIERAGRPMAVLIGVEEYEQLRSRLATLEEMLHPEALEKLERAKADIEAGRITPHEEVIVRIAEAKQGG